MVGSALVLLALLGTAALPPAQAHVAGALVHVAFDVSVVTMSVSRTAAQEVVVPVR